VNSQRKSWEIRMGWKNWDEFRDVPVWGPPARKLSGSNGIYELADENMRVVYVGYAGSRARYGLRGKLMDHFSDREPNLEIRGKARYFRYEVTSSYLSRWTEVIGRYNQLDALPPANRHARELPRRMPFFGPLREEASTKAAAAPTPPASS
jgi:hypothetical protein